jgi:hypothetical protein
MTRRPTEDLTVTHRQVLDEEVERVLDIAEGMARREPAASRAPARSRARETVKRGLLERLAPRGAPVGTNLAANMSAAGVTAAQLAREAGMPVQVVRQAEKSGYQLKASTRWRIAAAFNALANDGRARTVDDLFPLKRSVVP